MPFLSPQPQPQGFGAATWGIPTLSRCSCPQPGIHGYCGEAGGRGRQLAPPSRTCCGSAPGPASWRCEVGGGTQAHPLCRRRFQGVRNRCVCVVRGAGVCGAGAVPGRPEATLTRQPETRARVGSRSLGCERLLGRQTRFLFQHAFFKVHRGAAALSPRGRPCCL